MRYVSRKLSQLFLIGLLFLMVGCAVEEGADATVVEEFVPQAPAAPAAVVSAQPRFMTSLVQNKCPVPAGCP